MSKNLDKTKANNGGKMIHLSSKDALLTQIGLP